MRALRPWHLLLALAALAVPLQAGALTGGGSGPAGLSVSASLGECGVSESGISCRIDASWSGVEGATRYAASVTLADGSVTDMGTASTGSGGGSGSFWVPYVGDGVYTVTVTAWGTDPDGKEKKLDEKDAKAEAPGPNQGEDEELGAKGQDDGEGKDGGRDGPASDQGEQGKPDGGGTGDAGAGEQPKQPGGTEPEPEPEPEPEDPAPDAPAEPNEPPAEQNPVGPDKSAASGQAADERAAAGAETPGS